MSNSDIILEFLEENHPGEYCDDCISSQLEIKPRAQVNQICNRLSKQGTTKRDKGLCMLCHRQKFVNAFSTPVPGTSRAGILKEPAASYEVYDSLSDSQIDIEKMRTKIVRMCHELWQNEKGVDAPRSISRVINILKDENLLPWHQANMMLTLCNLRNVYVYEGLEMGHSERIVATGAWAIVSQWWESINKETRSN